VPIPPARLILICTLGALLAACGSRKPRIVVWIEVDSLRADALGCYGNHSTGEGGLLPSPRIDALAADGLRFEHAYACAPSTVPSLVSQFSGEWPWEQDQPRVPLVPRLHEKGWRTAGVTTSSNAGVEQGFERWDESFAQLSVGSHSPEALSRLLTFADELARDPGQGLFLFGWLSDPHYPYEEHAGLRFGPPYSGPLKGDEELGDLLARRSQLTDADKLQLRGRYQGEVACVDRALGGFVDELKRRGWYDEALIVLVSDHGEGLFDRGWIGHDLTLFDELVHVPWIVKLPASETGQRKGQSIPDVVSLIDLPATLIDWAEKKPRDPDVGLLGHSRSLLPLLRAGTPSARRWIYLRADFELGPAQQPAPGRRADVWGVIDAETALKWLVDHGQDPPRGMLYDLKHDLYEQNDLVQRMGAERAAPMQRLRGLVARALEGARGAPAVLPEEPWIARPADLEGAGPALLAERH
jgi:arylsulfatase A-like enzyme